MRDCDGAKGEDQTRLSSLSTASLSPPPSPAMLGLSSSISGFGTPRSSNRTGGTIGTTGGGGGGMGGIGTTPSSSATPLPGASLPPMRLSGGLGNNTTSSTARSLLRTPPQYQPAPSPDSSSSSSSSTSTSTHRRSSTAWLEWIAQPFLPRRIGLNLPPPKFDLPPLNEIVKDTAVPGVGRAFRMISSSSSCTSNTGPNEFINENNKNNTEISIGHATLRLDPEWVADMRVVLAPMFGTDENSVPVETKDENKQNVQNIQKVKHKNETKESSDESKLFNSTTNIEIEGISIWMVLEGPTSSKEINETEESVKVYVGNLNYDQSQNELEKLFGTFGEITECLVMKGFSFIHFKKMEDAKMAIEKLHGAELGGRILTVEVSRPRQRGNTNEDKNYNQTPSTKQPPSWCLIESDRFSSSSSSSSSFDEWFYKCNRVCLCTGTLKSSTGETGFHRGLAEQLSAFHLRRIQHDTPKYWQLQSTGLYRSVSKKYTFFLFFDSSTSLY